jgi:TonB family protein
MSSHFSRSIALISALLVSAPFGACGATAENEKSKATSNMKFPLEESNGAKEEHKQRKPVLPTGGAIARACMSSNAPKQAQAAKTPLPWKYDPNEDTKALYKRLVGSSKIDPTLFQRPWRKFVTRPKEPCYAAYVEHVVKKIELVGDENYPHDATVPKVTVTVQLTIAIKSDGVIERVEINRSSGSSALDEATKRIVYLAGPFTAFPDKIGKDTDILEITRTLTYGPEEGEEAEQP